MTQQKRKARKHIPNDTTRQLLVECGFKCPVPQCPTQWPTLQRHHIDEDPSNNEIGNLLMLCPTHHQMVTSGHIDRKTCEMLKELVGRFSQHMLSSDSQTNNRLLCSLVSELVMNMRILSDDKFHQSLNSEKRVPVLYPRLFHTVLDQAIASGIFILHELPMEIL